MSISEMLGNVWETGQNSIGGGTSSGLVSHPEKPYFDPTEKTSLIND